MRSTDLRENNLSKILKAAISEPGRLSRADIARRTRLTRTTVSCLVEELIESDLLTELDAVPGAPGRPKIPLGPAERTVLGIGVEIRFHSISVMGMDFSGTWETQESVPHLTKHSPMLDTVDLCVKLINEVIGRAESEWGVATGHLKVPRVCVAVPGRVSPDGECVLSAPTLEWSQVPFVRALREHPVMTVDEIVVANDNRLSVMDEMLANPGESFLYLRARSGVGGAIVSGGTLLKGSHGWAGEIGHTVVVPEGDICNCGRRGCLEAYVSPEAIRRLAGTGEEASVADALTKLREEQPITYQAQIVDLIGRSIANALNVLDLPTVVLGGYLAELGDAAFARISQLVSETALASDAEEVQIRRANAVGRSALAGATAVALQLVVQHPSDWLKRSHNDDVSRLT